MDGSGKGPLCKNRGEQEAKPSGLETLLISEGSQRCVWRGLEATTSSVLDKVEDFIVFPNLSPDHFKVIGGGGGVKVSASS